MNKPRTLPELLSTSDLAPLEGVLHRSKQLRRVASRVQKLLGPELSAHCQVANLRETTLILIVASTAWATRLRYQIPTLLQRFHEDKQLSAISDIQIRVIPENTPSSTLQPRRATMSADAAYGIRQFADSVEDEQLRSALTRLATRQSKKA